MIVDEASNSSQSEACNRLSATYLPPILHAAQVLGAFFYRELAASEDISDMSHSTTTSIIVVVVC